MNKDEKQARLAAALRANLRRRKAAGRDQAGEEKADGKADPTAD